MTLTTQQLSDPHGQVAFRSTGTGAPVVLIHGVGLQSAAWDPQIGALAAGWHVIALDLPGHGDSASLPRDAKLPDYVNWLDAVLRTLDLGPVNLAGHSMGALIAAGYTVRHPKNVMRVALLNGVFRRSEQAHAAVRARAADIRAGQFDPEIPLSRWFGDSPAENAARVQTRHWLSEVDPQGYATAYAAFANGDETYADRFDTISCPLLALTGDGDRNSTPEMSHAMATAATNGRALVIEEHRHMVNLTAPDQVNAALQDWLKTPLDREVNT